MKVIPKPLIEQLIIWRSAIYLMAQMFRLLFQFPWRRADISQQIVLIGIGSLPIITVATAFAGIVISDEIAWHMDLVLHTVDMIPGLSGQFIFRELGTTIPAMLLISKVGAAITAEVGSMKITEQIEALRLLRINPVSYLVFPRWIAMILSTACLTIIAVCVTVFCAMSVAVLHHGFGWMEYFNNFSKAIQVLDMLCALTKGLVFGAVIPVISCAYGFQCQGGAQGVGTATTNSVVSSTIAIIVLDFIITYLFTLLIQATGT